MIDIPSGIVCRFRVDGRPRTKGSLHGTCRKDARHTVHMSESGEYSKPWKLKMIREIQRHIHEWQSSRFAPVQMWVPCPLPVEVRAVYFFEREKGVNGLVKPSFDTPYPTNITIADLDKLDRNLLDALTQSKLIADDSQVVRLVTEKRWAPEGSGGSVQVHVLIAPAAGAL
jgi:Holliday junction resolvase RusA-like endonuclease